MSFKHCAQGLWHGGGGGCALLLPWWLQEAEVMFLKVRQFVHVLIPALMPMLNTDQE